MSFDVSASPHGLARRDPGGATVPTDLPLGTADWTSVDTAVEKFRIAGCVGDGHVWMGQAIDRAATPLGYTDDRHVCLVSGSRGGKGVGVIVPNLCMWPGSAVVVDPKGENATITAQRRGNGSDYAHGMHQKVRILDPFGEVQLPKELKARYNPLDAIDVKGDLAIDDAGRVAAALVVIENKNDPYWEEAARNLIKGLILHVLSAPYLRAHRDLVGVRRLLTQGDWITVDTLRRSGEEDIPSAFQLLWTRMRRNPALNGVVAGVGEQMIAMADKQRSGVLESARTSTQFLDSPPMQRILRKSDFDLSELKTSREGLTIYLTLPARYMETHFRWLRLMVTLATGEMERIKGRPATGYPTLFLLDEFAGLKRMETIEYAAAQAAGFGVKFLFVVQNLPQIAELYEKSWETFLGNSGLKLFFQIDDDFTRSYLARQLGELEVLRQSGSGSATQSSSDSRTEGRSSSYNSGRATSRRPLLGLRTSVQSSSGYSDGTSSSRSRSSSTTSTEGWSEAVHKRSLLNPDEIGRMLARIDDQQRTGYPGLVLALIPGEHPLLARRVNYFESSVFEGCFDPHPNYAPPPTLAELAARPRPEQPTLRQFPTAAAKSGFSVGRVVAGLVLGLTVLTVLIALVVNASRRPPSSTNAPGSARPAAPAPAPAAIPAAPPSPSPQSQAYDQGVADWRALQAWFAVQTGDRRAGADWWAAHRSHNPEPCEEAAEDYADNQQISALFEAGCNDAKRILDRVDIRRTDPQYKAGFNDEAKRDPLN